METKVPQIHGIPFEGDAAIIFVLTLFAFGGAEQLSEEMMVRSASRLGVCLTPTDLEPALNFLKGRGVLECVRQPSVSGGFATTVTAWKRI